MADAYAELIRLAAQMVRCQSMPQIDAWNWPRGATQRLWREAVQAEETAQEQCRQWARAIKEIADALSAQQPAQGDQFAHPRNMVTTPPAPTVPDVLTYSMGTRECVDGWNDCRAAMLASGGKASVPDGWKLVPLEATEEMVSALRAGTIEPQGMVQQARIIERIKSDYRKFLAAAPEVTR